MNLFNTIISKSSSNKTNVFLILALALLVRLVYSFILMSCNPEGILMHDSIDYIQLGNNLYSNFLFSRETTSPFFPEHIRVPFYPIITGLFGSNYFSIIFLQIALSTLNIYTLYLILKQLISDNRFINFGLVLMSFSINSIALSNVVLTETLSESLLLSSFYFLMKGYKNLNAKDLLISSFFFSLLIFTKPLFLWVFPILFSVVLFKTKKFKSVIFLVFPLVVFLGWGLRNYKTFDTFFYSNIDVQNLAYFRAAQIDASKNGLSLELNQDLIRTNTNEKLKSKFTYNYQKDTPVFYKQLKNDAIEKISDNPVLFFKLNLINFGKLIINPVNKFVYSQLSKEQTEKDFLIRNHSFKQKAINFIRQLTIGNLFLLIGSLFYSVIILGALIFSIINLFKFGHHDVYLFIICFLSVLIFSIGPEADSRLRYPLEPLAIIIGLVFLNNYFSRDENKKEFN